MRAAIYARKSTKDDNEESEKSVERQTEGARTFIAQHGWSLDDAHIYTDLQKSGALFLGRPEFQRMLRDAERGAFDVVVLFDLDRLGRHAHKTMEARNALADCGVQVWDYSTGQAVDVDSMEGELMTSLRARFAQQFREQVRKHTKDAMRRKAERGLHTHGKVFGYDLRRVGKGHCELIINEAEAAIVRRIYTQFANGEGARTIARGLNAANIPKPRAQQGRPDGWSVSTIRAVLKRPLYRGEVIYGRTSKAYNRELRRVYRHTTREKGQIPMPEETWIRRDAPHLRIIDEDLAARVDRRLRNRRERYQAALARNDGRRPQNAVGRYLLSGGMLLCPTCGGNFEARKYPWKPSRKTLQRNPNEVAYPGGVYICSTRRRKPGICTNTLALPIEETDDAVLSVIEGEVLGTAFIQELLSLLQNAPGDVWLTAERDRLHNEVARLVESIAAGVPADTVAPLIRTKEAELRRLEGQLMRASRTQRVPVDQLRAALEQRAADWKADLRATPKIARAVLRRLVGPLTLWDDSERPDFVKWTANPTTELLDGLATLEGSSPTGFDTRYSADLNGIWVSDRAA